MRDLATRYSSEELKQEVAMLAEKKKTFLYFIVNGNRLVAADGGTYVAKISIKKGKFRIYSCANSYIATSIGGTWYYY